jgi:TonB family protein
MAEEETYRLKWSIEEIHDYLEGTMSGPQAAEFEADLLNDPFLKDAVDGFQGHAKLYVDHHLQRLNKEFQGEKSRVMIPIWSLTAVAAIALLVAAGWFVLTHLPSSDAGTADHQVKNLEESSTQKLPEQRMVTDADSTSLISAMAAEDEFDAEDEIGGTGETGPVATTLRRRKPKSKLGGIVSGTVIDSDGQPLIGANVYFPNNDAAITTDFNGNFAVELKAYDSVAIVNYVGYESGVFNIDEQPKQQFQLTESLALQEVVILNSKVEPITSLEDIEQQEQAGGNLADRAMLADQSGDEVPVRAAPEKGFKKYERYIKRNLNYPLDARNEKIEGDVVVQFKVLPNGEYYDIRIMKSLGYGCDEEVMRLIKEGPQWKSEVENRIGEATYTVEFRRE